MLICKLFNLCILVRKDKERAYFLFKRKPTDWSVNKNNHLQFVLQISNVKIKLFIYIYTIKLKLTEIFPLTVIFVRLI